MKVQKSSCHSKITSDFSEGLVLYWLSKDEFECALVDHAGVDIIGRNKKRKELMGITFKSRSRGTGTGGQYLKIPNDTFAKVEVETILFAALAISAGISQELIYRSFLIRYLTERP